MAGAVEKKSHSDEAFEHDLEKGSSPRTALREHPAQFLANPAPLGLLCFGMTTVMLMFAVTGWVNGTWVTIVACYAVIYGGIGQFVAGVFEIVKGNTFAGTAFISYGAFWIGFFIKEYFLRGEGVLMTQFQTDSQVGETLFFVLWGVFTTAFFVPTLRKNLCLMVVFGTLSLTFFLLAGGEWSPSCHKAAGYVGFICGLSAIYTAVAELYQESLGIIMPGLRPVSFI